MVCGSCGAEGQGTSGACGRCGAALSPNGIRTSPLVQDRGPFIVALGVLAIIILGPLAGVPGWLMANQDLHDLRAGLIRASASGTLKVGRGLNIAGTFFSPLWLFCFAIIAFVLGEMLFTFLAFL
jgi:hypothetical protein